MFVQTLSIIHILQGAFSLFYFTIKSNILRHIVEKLYICSEHFKYNLLNNYQEFYDKFLKYYPL